MDFSQSYFELFSLPESFTIDKARLAERYRELQKVVHPDRYASGSDQERRLAMQQATFINEALQTLKNPLARGRYLLSRHGIDMDLEKESTADTAFLMEQLELREELDGVKHQADPYAALDKLMAQVNKRINTLMEAISAGFDNPLPEHLEEIRENLRKMQFLCKLQHQAEELEAELDE